MKVNKNPKRVFGTYEWAYKNVNFISGCKHDCKYCYSKEMAIRFGRKTSANWKKESLKDEMLSKKFGKSKGVMMIPSSHDIHPDHLKEALIILNNILSAGNQILIVSKPHTECIKAICDEFFVYRKDILFRFSIGSIESKVLKFWEPGAPNFAERLESLKYAYNSGFKTSVSVEPMLDSTIDEIIRKVRPLITDSIWLGKANYLFRRITTNGDNDALTLKKADELIKLQSDFNIKKLYERYKNDPLIKWKESIKKIVGIELSEEKGLDA